MDTSMPPPAPRRKEDMRKQAMSGLLSAMGPGQAGLTKSVLDASASAHSNESTAGTSAAGLLSSKATEVGTLPDWTQYWDEKKTVDLPDRGGKFNVYCAGSKGPILLVVHGAGYTGLSWSLVASSLKDRYRVVAPDLRGHGLTSASPKTEFSKQMMSEDLVALWHALFPEPPPKQLSAPEPPADTGPVIAQPLAAAAGDPRATVLVGHSMGGAVAVWTAATRSIPSLAGCVVVDVVEGTALAALPHMMGIIAARPTHFPTPSAAISWAIRTGMSRCKAAAAISMPSQLVQAASCQGPEHAGALVSGTASQQATVTDCLDVQPGLGHPSLLSPNAAIQEEAEEDEGDDDQPLPQQAHQAALAADCMQPALKVAGHEQPDTSSTVSVDQAHRTETQDQAAGSRSGRACDASLDGWVWRTPLVATQPYWQEWYTGLSDTFLSLPLPKMLLLAGTDRLDKSLTIGQMQGKFQLVVLPTAGHAIQEDDAPATAAALDIFCQRQRIGAPPLALPRVTGVKPVLPIVAGPTL